ncbi:WG repeat-containing protein [Leptospira sp. 201903070]|uniref:WG repeat-containing protein n=1 Tax=Leptospira ainlahdjerensis TaxID=2810033 RepID=A0ABS2U8H4_9LEPT|nr:WG repeat-containing protein [Leptospira ainlahdjerensis]MBM9576238.1 WG repeat-containing protein [Leptospira ainlahdjerensis]
MNRFFWLPVTFSILIPFLLNCKKEPFSSFEENGKYGFKDSKGNVAIKPQYSFSYDFDENGVTFVFGNGEWSCIDEKNRVLLNPFLFDNGPDPFLGGLARFKENHKIGFFDPQCNKIIPALFDFAFPFEEDLTLVCLGCKSVKLGEHSKIEGGEYGLIDKKGNIIVPIEYDSISTDLDKKIARVTKGKLTKDIPIL